MIMIKHKSSELRDSEHLLCVPSKENYPHELFNCQIIPLGLIILYFTDEGAN